MISYTATLSRTGNIYSVTSGVLVGGPFGGSVSQVVGQVIASSTQRIISNFMSRRMDQITASDPDLVDRLTGGTSNGIGGPVNFTANGTLANNQLAFSTSLRQIMTAGETSKAKARGGLGQMMALGSQSPGAEHATKAPGFDVWIQGKWAQVDDETRESDIGLLYIGADYRVSSSLVFGVLAQFDWTDEADNTQNTAADGKGWMVGPYVVARLHDNLILDGRVAWGQSDNHVDPFGAYKDSFDGERWLARARLTGDFRDGPWRFMPHVGVIYFEEDQKAYTDSLGFYIPGQTISLGRVTFGPQVSYSYQVADGTTITPHIGIKGIWDFDKAEIVDIGTGLAVGSSDDVRARVEGGISARFANGWSITGQGFYDGIGADDLDIYGGSVKVGVPLN